MLRSFYMVWNETTKETKYRHATLEAAKAKAERLARINPGIRFYVLQAIGGARKADVDWQGCGDGLPF